MFRNCVNRREVEDIIESRLKVHMSEVDKRISKANEHTQNAILAKLDEIRNELKESQERNGSKITDLEKNDLKASAELDSIKSHMGATEKALDRIEGKLNKSITTDNLEEKLQRPLQDIKDKIADLGNVPSKKRSDLFEKICWTVGAAVLTILVTFVLSHFGLV